MTTRTAPAAVDATARAGLDAYWRAANYLSVGQIYLLDNPLLREPLRPEHVKPRLLGHWGTTPGLNFVYAHLNRVITRARPGRDLRHRARARRPGLVANAWLEGTYSEIYPRHRPRRGRACAGCSASSPSPAASPATSRPRRPGSIHEGGELGYSLVARLRRRVRQPRPARRLRRRRRRGRDRPAGHELALQQVPRPGRATARCCRSCTSTATRSPTRRCWPASPRTSSTRCCAGYGYDPLLRRAATTRPTCTSAMAAALDEALDEIAAIQAARARGGGRRQRPRWPMIVLRTPKGWTGPRRSTACRWRAPGARTRCRWPDVRDEPRAPAPSSRSGCAVYRPEELFDADGAPMPRRPGAAARGRAADGREPARQRRPAPARPAAARLPRLRASPVTSPARPLHEADPRARRLLRDVIRDNAEHRNFRLFGPDETASNRLDAVFEATDRGVGGRDRSPATSTWRPTAG